MSCVEAKMGKLSILQGEGQVLGCTTLLSDITLLWFEGFIPFAV